MEADVLKEIEGVDETDDDTDFDPDVEAEVLLLILNVVLSLMVLLELTVWLRDEDRLLLTLILAEEEKVVDADKDAEEDAVKLPLLLAEEDADVVAVVDGVGCSTCVKISSMLTIGTV